MLANFDKIWALDFEFRQRDGELPEPWCAVGVELRTGERRVWRHTNAGTGPVYSSGARDLVVAYAAEAEGKCIRALDWPMPSHRLDLLPLYRRSRNEFGAACKATLLDALGHHQLPGMASAEKEEFRALARRGAPFSMDEMNALVAYCGEDVEATARLLPLLLPGLDLSHALLMGRYTMGAVSAIYATGIPVDAPLLHAVVIQKEVIQRKIIAEIDPRFGVFDGTAFRLHKFQGYLERERIQWPSTPTGALALDDDTFRSQAFLHPKLGPLREARKTLAAFRTVRLSVGSDGRSRSDLLPFSSRTGRNQPRASSFIYGWPSWMRHLITPPPGKALISLDFEQQEFLIGAALSGDTNMLKAYESGDPYLYTAALAGAAPAHASKESHGEVRALFKTAVLGMQYQITERGLAQNLGSLAVARELIQHHRRLYARYHQWSEQCVDHVSLGGTLRSPFGWAVRAGSLLEFINPRSVANWSVQAAGADILRIATIALVENGFEVAALVHDSVLLVTDLGKETEVAKSAARLMREASAVVLGGHECRVEAKLTRPGGLYCGEAEPELMRYAKEALEEAALAS